MKKIAVIGAYKKNYEMFLHSLNYHSVDKFIFINSIDKCYGREFLDYIMLFDIEHLNNSDNIIETIKIKIR